MRIGLIRPWETLGKAAGSALLIALLSSCSDPSLPPPSGAMSLTFSTQTGGKAPLCPPADHLANAPLSLGGTPQVTGTSLFEEAHDGLNNNWVKCSVQADGDKYHASVEAISQGLDATGAQVTSDLFARVTISENEEAVQGTIHVSDGATGLGRYISDACLFTVLPDTGNNARLGVGAGRIWAQVHCAQIDDMRNFSGQECALDGYLAFDHCTQ